MNKPYKKINLLNHKLDIYISDKKEKKYYAIEEGTKRKIYFG